MTRLKHSRREFAIFALIQLLVFADIWVKHVNGVSIFALASTACAAATLDLT
jgi:hypothetical protein